MDILKRNIALLVYLGIHHSTMITISSTKAAKIIENQNGVSFINTIG